MIKIKSMSDRQEEQVEEAQMVSSIPYHCPLKSHHSPVFRSCRYNPASSSSAPQYRYRCDYREMVELVQCTGSRCPKGLGEPSADTLAFTSVGRFGRG